MTREIILQFLHSCNQFVWGGALLFLLMGTHLFYTIRLKFVQRFVFRGIRYSLSAPSGAGQTSPLTSLSTILAATIGIGNIVGISTAIALGGPGAVLWCWLTGILGMATSYAECYLSLRHRQAQDDGSWSGGPMYVLEHGLHCLPLGILFSLFTILASLGVGCTTQAQAAAEAAHDIFHIPAPLTGILLALLAGFALIGGARSINKICMKLVPAMGLFYLCACFFLLFLNRDYVIPSISLICRSAFLPQAATGGFIGSTILLAARFGVARGLFTNEAGLGSAPIAAASGDYDLPSDPFRSGEDSGIHRAALVSMTAVFWDTIILCAVTGIAIVSHIMRYPNSSISLPSTELTHAAFSSIPYIGTPMLTLSILAFSFATILGWYYFGEQALRYLISKLPTKHKQNPTSSPLLRAYQVLYMLMIYWGSHQSGELIWELTDFLNACMALPNLLCLLLLFRQIRVKQP